jgi:hypothetical protein
MHAKSLPVMHQTSVEFRAATLPTPVPSLVMGANDPMSVDRVLVHEASVPGGRVPGCSHIWWLCVVMASAIAGCIVTLPAFTGAATNEALNMTFEAVESHCARGCNGRPVNLAVEGRIHNPMDASEIRLAQLPDMSAGPKVLQVYRKPIGSGYMRTPNGCCGASTAMKGVV